MESAPSPGGAVVAVRNLRPWSNTSALVSHVGIEQRLIALAVSPPNVSTDPVASLMVIANSRGACSMALLLNCLASQ